MISCGGHYLAPRKPPLPMERHVAPTKEWLSKGLGSRLAASATSADIAAALYALGSNPLRVRIGGYPACGKTTLSRQLSDHLGGALHIQSESWIIPLAERRAKDLSGAHPESYDTARALTDLALLLEGTPTYLAHYSHKLGRHDGGETVHMLPSGHLVLDGTPFTLHDFDVFSDLCLFLVPARFEDWITQAIERDVQTRFFTKAEATRHNMRKARDLDLVWSRSPQAMSVKCHLSSSQFYYEVSP